MLASRLRPLLGTLQAPGGGCQTVQRRVCQQTEGRPGQGGEWDCVWPSPGRCVLVKRTVGGGIPGSGNTCSQRPRHWKEEPVFGPQDPASSFPVLRLSEHPRKEILVRDAGHLVGLGVSEVRGKDIP